AAVGLVAVVVDFLAVSLAAPACAGLVLLGVLIGPAVVSDRMLPWWSFALSAVAFALLLAVDTQRRQSTWGDAVVSGRVGSAGPVTAAGTVIAGAVAVAVALFIGATVTAVGTGRAHRTREQG